MTRYPVFGTAVVVSLLVGVAVCSSAAAAPPAPGPPAPALTPAQQSTPDPDNVTATVAATANPTPTPTAGANRTEEVVDDHVTLSDWDYRDDAFILEFDADRASVVTVVPSQQTGEGAAQFSWTEERIPRGGGTLTVPAEKIEGEAEVQITTRRSRADQRGVVVSTGMINSNPFRHLGGASGVVLGVGVTVLASLGAACWVVRQESKGVETA